MTDRFDLYQRGELRQFLVVNFDERELQSLFADLGIDYDRLPGSGTENKARELIAYCERRQQLDQLIAAIRRERPFFDPRGLDMLDNGADLFVGRSPGETYYPLADLIQPIVTAITTRPGYHVIEAEMGMGKTALIGYLLLSTVSMSRLHLRICLMSYATSRLHQPVLLVIPTSPTDWFVLPKPGSRWITGNVGIL